MLIEFRIAVKNGVALGLCRFVVSQCLQIYICFYCLFLFLSFWQCAYGELLQVCFSLRKKKLRNSSHEIMFWILNIKILIFLSKILVKIPYFRYNEISRHREAIPLFLEDQEREGL